MSLFGMAVASSQIIHLRQLLAERFPQSYAPAADRLATGIAAIDQETGGGLPKSAITELSSPYPSAGSALFVHALLRTAHRDRFFLALIDGRDSFDPQTACPQVLSHLLWVRCQRGTEAVQAADFLLRDGNFPLVVLDLVLNPAEELRKIPQTHWYRLQRLVEAAPTAFLVLTRRSIISSAQLKLSFESAWRLRDLDEGDLTARIKLRAGRVHGTRQIMARAG